MSAGGDLPVTGVRAAIELLARKLPRVLPLMVKMMCGVTCESRSHCYYPYFTWFLVAMEYGPKDVTSSNQLGDKR